jgi:NADH-ubiquinone oxidoreductase chain 5
LNHATFKALLFLSAGAIIHAVSDIQDIRKMGSLIIYLPKTYSFFIIGSLSLMAFPFFTGFYSKDVLLELALIPNNTTSSMAYLFTFIAAI